MDAGVSAVLRLVALVVSGLLLVRVMRRGRVRGAVDRRRQTRDQQAAAVAAGGGFLMFCVVTFAGVVQALGIATAPGFLTTLYTLAAVIAAISGSFYLLRRQS